MKQGDLAFDWVEYMFVFFMVGGIVLSLFINRVFVSYIVIIICGMLCGRVNYRMSGYHAFPYYVIVAGFLLGYLIGNSAGNVRMIVIMFVVSGAASYYLHAKEYIQ